MHKVPLIALSLLLVWQLIYVCHGAATNRVVATQNIAKDTKPSKRSLIGFGGFEENGGWPNEWNQFMNANPWNTPNFPAGPWTPHKSVPSQMEVSSAIAAAKQASENVLIAQQQMMAAKENLVQQQKLASERDANAQIAQQKLESVAALQRSEAAAAAQAVILAHQRLAASKSDLSHHQKLASLKESHAAEFLRRSAHAASLDLQRTEAEAIKQSNLHRNGNAASLHHLAATKDTLIAPIFNGNNRVPGASLLPLAPWSTIAAPSSGGLFNPLSSPHPPQAAFFNPHKENPFLWG